jgi:integrative and conjugative element protein (TIGR02256 family)
MIFKDLFINKDALDFIECEVRETKNDVETGGVLMGYYTVKDEVVITHCCGPGPKAIQKRYSIFLDSSYAQEFVNEVYTNSDGQITYIGDWHSHTSSNLTPSRTDKIELNKIVKNKQSRLGMPIMVITNFAYEVLSIKGFYYKSKKIHEFKNIYPLD